MCVLIVLVPRLVPRKPDVKVTVLLKVPFHLDVLSVQPDSVHVTVSDTNYNT